MFKPGHLRRELLPDEFNPQHFVCDIYYEVREDAQEGKKLHVHVQGSIDGNPFDEEFEQYWDVAFNFLDRITRILTKHGLEIKHGAMLREHAEYDAMFADIRAKLGVRPGEPVNLDHLSADCR